MTSALVLGDRRGGTTTFLGLLYLSLVRAGGEEGGTLRVHASHASLRALQEVFSCLMQGRFPPDRVELRSPDLSFLLGNPPPSRWISGLRSQTPLAILQGDVEELSDLRRHSVVGDEGLRERLASRVPIILVDASRLRFPPEPSVPSSPFRPFDQEVADVLTLLASYAAAQGARAGALHPIFVLTKLDLLPPHLRSEGAGGSPPPVSDLSARTAWGERLVADHLPRVMGALAPLSSSSPFEAPRFFVSWVEVDSSGPEGPVIRRRASSPVGGWEPVYPQEEYRALVDHLYRLAREERGRAS